VGMGRVIIRNAGVGSQNGNKDRGQLDNQAVAAREIPRSACRTATLGMMQKLPSRSD
jgi:hypothetical protein